MKSRLTAALAIALLTRVAVVPAADAPATPPQQPIPSYTVQRAVDPITVDGVAKEETWQKASRVSAFVTWDGKETPDQTDVKMAWNDEALYMLFICRDADIQASITNHDGALYTEEVVEAFIDSDADEKTYMELIVNPLNTTFDNFVLCNPHLNPNAGIVEWTLKGWQTAVTVDGTVRALSKDPAPDTDKQWIVEMKIPWAQFVLTVGPSGKPPRDGDVWRMALTRYDRPGGQFLHTAWSAPYSAGWPHMTERFGKVVFSLKRVGEQATEPSP